MSHSFSICEEVDYLRRVRECGFSVAYVPQAQAVHIEGKHTENPDFSALLSANRIRYYRRYHGPLSTAVFRLSIIVGEGIRAVIRRSPGHRAAVRAALKLGVVSSREPAAIPSSSRQCGCFAGPQQN